MRAAAEAIGFQFSMLSRIEAGEAHAPPERFAKIAEVYGTTVEELREEEAIHRRRIEVPDNVPDDEIRAIVQRLSGTQPTPKDPHSFTCPKCGASCRVS